MHWRYLNLPELSDAFDQLATENGDTLCHRLFTDREGSITGILLAVVVRALLVTHLFIDSVQIRLGILLFDRHVFEHILAVEVSLVDYSGEVCPKIFSVTFYYQAFESFIMKSCQFLTYLIP